MNKKYVAQKCTNYSDGVNGNSYDSWDVHLEDDNGFTWICECGRRSTAIKIDKLLNKDINKKYLQEMNNGK